MKKAITAIAIAASLSTSASAYEVHKKVPAYECDLIKSGLIDKGYSKFTHKFTTLWEQVDGIMFNDFYVNIDNGKAYAQNRLTHWCHIFVGTVDDLQKFKDAQELSREKRKKAGNTLASKYGL